MLHVWNIYLHLPQTWPSYIGKYSIHGASGIRNTLFDVSIPISWLAWYFQPVWRCFFRRRLGESQQEMLSNYGCWPLSELGADLIGLACLAGPKNRLVAHCMVDLGPFLQLPCWNTRGGSAFPGILLIGYLGCWSLVGWVDVCWLLLIIADHLSRQRVPSLSIRGWRCSQPNQAWPSWNGGRQTRMNNNPVWKAEVPCSPALLPPFLSLGTSHQIWEVFLGVYGLTYHIPNFD